MAVVYTDNGWNKLWPMNTHTIIMMLTLVVAGLAIGCSSAPATTAVPVVLQMFLTPDKAIAIARTAVPSDGRPLLCWATEPYVAPGDNGIASNFSYTEKARLDLPSFDGQPLPITYLSWMVTAQSSWTWKDKDNETEISEITYLCDIWVDDATGTVSQTLWNLEPSIIKP